MENELLTLYGPRGFDFSVCHGNTGGPLLQLDHTQMLIRRTFFDKHQHLIHGSMHNH